MTNLEKFRKIEIWRICKICNRKNQENWTYGNARYKKLENIRKIWKMRNWKILENVEV